MKKIIKRCSSLFLVLVLACSMVFPEFAGTKNVIAASDAITEESLMDTAGVEQITAQRNTDTRLGAVSDVNCKFTFELTHPGANATGGMKLNLFSTGNGHVWQGGYLLCIGGVAADTVDFALRSAVGETLLSYPGGVSVAAADYMTISAWIESGVLHITVNGAEIITYTNNIETGVYMGVYNEWSSVAEFRNVNVNGETLEFEELDDTLGVNSVTAPIGASTNLGSISSVQKGFAFKVSHPGTANANKMIKVGLFNTVENNCWANGYILTISGRTDTKVDFALRKGSDEGLISYPGELEVSGEQLTINAWLSAGAVHISLNGTEIIAWTNNGTVTEGVNFAVYNEWATEAIFSVLTGPTEEDDDPLLTYPDIPTDITFEDLNNTLGEKQVSVAKGTGTNLGQLTEATKGFVFRITRPTPASAGAIKLGFYNTDTANPWRNGYILIISSKNVDGNIDFAVRKGADETLIAYPGEFSGFEGEYLTVNVWLSNGTFYVGVNGKVITSWTNDGSVQEGLYLSAYNEWQTETKILAMADDEEDDGFDSLPDIPTDITFEDLGVTAGINSTVAAKANGTNLGQLSSKDVGFKFKITRPTSQESGMIKIGLYNTVDNNPWGNGYILVIGAKGVEGTVDFAVRKGSDETLIAYPGEIAGLTGENLDIYAWIEGDTFYIGLNGKVLTSWTNDGSVDIGTYLCAYNELSINPTIWTFTEVDDDPVPTYPDVPTDIIFEDLGVTAGINSTVAVKASGTNLGQLSSKNVGFKFKITRPASPVSGMIKVGLFNTESDNPWGDGYILIIGARGVEGTVDFAVRKGLDETLIAYPGEITGLTGENLDIYAWIEENTFYVGLNGKVITSWTNDGSVNVGTHLCAYNELSINPTIWTFTEVDDDPLAKYPNVPKNIKYEDIGQTKQKNRISASKAVATDLGKLSSKNIGFKFKLEVPKTTNTSEMMKIGIYNTQQYNPWTDGFLVTISTKPSQGTLDFAIRKGIDETLISYPGEFQDLGKEITVLTWIEKDVFYLAVNDKVIASWENDGSVKVGTYITVYSEWSIPAVFKTINEVDENANLVPDTSGGITFMDLGQTARKNSIELVTARETVLGQLSSVKNGFKFKVTPVDNSELSSVKIGLYNTKVNNPWADGYILIFSGLETKGNISLCLRKGKDEMLIALPDSLMDIDKDIEVEVWLTDVDAANGAHTFHAKINGKEIITYTNKDGSVLIGPHLSAYNERKQQIFIKTYTIVDESAFPAPPDTSDGVEFQDLGKTVKSNMVNCADKTTVNLGKVSSTKHGFVFEMTTPSAKDAGKLVKIGLYNLEKKNPWTDGYILCISAKEKEGVLDFALRKGKDEMLLCYPGEFSGFNEETITIKAWLTDTEAKGNAHTIHVSINGVEYLTYTNEDGSVQIGTYMSAYNDGMQTLTFYTMEKVMEPSDLYLQRFGDPTDINGLCRVELAEDDKNEGEGNTAISSTGSKILMVGVAGIAIISMFAVFIVQLLKRKRNSNK